MIWREQLRENLRQVIALLQEERQALAGLNIASIMDSKPENALQCGTLDNSGAFAGDPILDEECQGLLEAAWRMNEINREVHNLIAAGVAARLDILSRRTRILDGFQQEVVVTASHN